MQLWDNARRMQMTTEQIDLLAGEGGSHLLPPPSAHLLAVLLNNQVLTNNLHQSDNDDVGP